MPTCRAATAVAVCLGAACLLALRSWPDDTFDALSKPPLIGAPRQSVRLLVLVPTAKETHRAANIRRAYAIMMKHPSICIMAGDCPFRVRLIFVVGDPNSTKSSVSGDLLTVSATDIDPDVNDATILVSSTTTKVLEALRWAASCGDCYDYVLRQGDDAHVNLLNLFDRLTTAPPSRWLLGRFMKNGRIRESWLRQFLMSKTFPPYPHGMGYVMSRDVAEAIAALRMPIVCYPEDAVLGIWLLGMNVIFEDTKAFHNRLDHGIGSKSHKAPCRPTDILTHYMLPGDYAEINPVDFSVKC